MNTPNNSNSPADEEQQGHKSLIEVLFGTKIEDCNINEGCIEKALELKVEREKTKQQYYKLENTNRSIELLKLARDTGVPGGEITRIFGAESAQIYMRSRSNEGEQIAGGGATPVARNGQKVVFTQCINSGTATQESANRQPLSYRFPATGSNLLPKPVTLNNGTRELSFRRTNSPARIGASAVAALNDSITIKEEDIPSNGSPFSRKTNNHNRNQSLPIAKFNNVTIPSGMTSILSFNKTESETTTPGTNSQPLSFSNSTPSTAYQLNGNSSSNVPVVRKASMIVKKHRRTKSASSFGVIDLNVIDEAKQHDIQRIKAQEQKLAFEKHHDYDEKTCSESSSRNGSPLHTASTSEIDNTKNLNPVAKILNST